jgi:acetylornithine aminotransferase
VKGQGCILWDDQGNQYLDALSGIAVCGLGHAHPAVTQAITEQANTLLHASNLFATEPQELLGERLREISGLDKVFFSNSGAEANEAAIKIARKYGHQQGIQDPLIITAEGSFHGRTMATLTATGNPKVKTGFAPLLSGFIHAPYNDIDAIEQLLQANANAVAVMVEPVQGEGGINIPSADYLSKLRALCDRHKTLLILDEIQTGNGRTGRYFAYQWHEFLPDVVTTAKGLGNGLPIGACLARGPAAEVLVPGSHGSTFGGNPVCAQAALAVVDNLCNGGWIDRADSLGKFYREQLTEALADCDLVKEIRVFGLMIGIELYQANLPVVEKAAAQGLILNLTAGNVVRMLPPLITTKDQAKQAVEIIANVLRAI